MSEITERNWFDIAIEQCRTESEKLVIEKAHREICEMRKPLDVLPPIHQLLELVIAKRSGQCVEQGKQVESVFSREVLERMANGVCACVPKPFFRDSVVKAPISALKNTGNGLVHIIQLNRVCEGKSYCLIFDSSDDDLYRFFAGEGGRGDIVGVDVLI